MAVAPRRRLRFRMAAGVALGFVTLLSVFAVLMAWAVKLSTDAVYHERLLMARTTARSVDDLLGQSLHQVEALAGEVAWDAAGRSPSPEQPLLARLVHISGTFQSVAVIDRSGGSLWSEGPPEDRSALQTAQTGRLAIEQRRSQIGSASLIVGHPPVALVATPLNNVQGDVAGAIIATVHLAHQGGELVPLPDASDLRVELVDRSGRVLRGSGGGDRPALSGDHLALLTPWLQVSREQAALHESSGGRPHLVAFAPFQRLPGGVFFEETEDRALMVPRELQRIGVFVGSTALLLVSLGAWWYARRITRPLEELTAAARSLAAGSFDRPVRIASQDELGVLGASFEEMRVRLKKDFDDRLRWEEELERQVQERTQTVRQLLDKVITAQEEERKRVARELHDGAAQDLAALLVALDGVEVALAMSEPQRGLIQGIKREARQALQEVRRLLLDLRPSALDELGLAPAVRWFLESRLMGLGIRGSVHVEGAERRLPAALETTLFRIVQEAVNNAARHAAPRNVLVRLKFGPEEVVATIEDDGKGFDPARLDSPTGRGGLGLVGMRERAALAGGRVEVESQPGIGSRITVQIPSEEDHVSYQVAAG